MQMNTPPVLYESRGSIGWITLNRPEVLNAINPAMLHGLLKILDEASKDSSTRVLILTGSGRAFSAGGDIKAMQAMDEPTFSETIHLYMRLSQAMRDLDQPVIAAVNGYALAGGFELMLLCDIRIAAASAKFGLPDTIIGLSPTSGMTWLLPRIVGLGHAMHLTLEGNMIDAQKAERIGLVTGVVEDDALHKTVEKLAATIGSFPEVGVTNTKRGFYSALESTSKAAMKSEEKRELECFQFEDTRKAFAAFLARKKK